MEHARARSFYDEKRVIVAGVFSIHCAAHSDVGVRIIRRNDVNLRREPAVEIQYFRYRTTGRITLTGNRPPHERIHPDVDERRDIVNCFSGFGYRIDIFSNAPGGHQLGCFPTE